MGSADTKGRLVLWAVTAFMLAVPVYFLFIVAPQKGQEAEGLLRLGVTIFLLYSMHKGRPWARPVLAFFALTGAVYLNVRLAFFLDGLTGREIIELSIKDIIYTASGLALVFSRSLRDCLDRRGGSGKE